MKTKLLLAVLVLGFFVSGCKKEYITQEIIPNTTIQTTVANSAWVYDASTQTYYVQINMPEINDGINQTDGVLVYISGDGTTWEALPDVYNGSTIIYTYKPGALFLEIQGADGSTVNPPNDLYVKIVLVASNPE